MAEPTDPEQKRPLTAAEAQRLPKPERRRRQKPSSKSTDSETEWGGERVSKGANRFLIWGGILVLAAIIGGVVVVTKLRRGANAGKQTFIPTTESFEPPELDTSPENLDDSLPRTWFDRKSGILPARSAEILMAVQDAGETGDLSGLVRESSAIDELRRDQKGIFASPPILDRFDDWALSVEVVGDKAFSVFKGKRINFKPFNYYFVRSEDDDLLLDWEASAGYSEMPFSDLVEGQIQGPTTVRAILRKTHYYVGPYKEKDWSSWELADPKGGAPLYAYVPAKSEQDKTLLGWLDYGKFILELKKERKGTFKIVPPKDGARPNQVEISEILTSDWVLFED